MDLRNSLLGQVHRLHSLGNIDEARALAENAVKAHPQDAMGWAALAVVKAREGLLEEAEADFLHALEVEPNDEVAANSFMAFLIARGRFREAVDLANEVLEVAPNEDLAGQLVRALGSLKDQVGALNAANRWFAVFPKSSRLAFPRLMHLLYPSDVDERDIYAAHRDYAAGFEREAPRLGAFTNSRIKERKLKIGYVSSYFIRHATTHFLLGLLAGHDRSKVNVTLYSMTRHADEITEQFRAIADQFHDLVSADMVQVAQQIRGDKIDILIDLDGATSHFTDPLIALEPAPVQAAYLGYPFPMCLRALRYRIVDALTDPIDAPPPEGTDYVEETWRLDRHFLCYRSATKLPVVQPLSPAAPVFGSFNNPQKISDACIALWAGALLAVPEARLLLKYSGITDPQNAERLLLGFDSHGISSDRIELRAATKTIEDHLAMYDDLHVAFDTIPYNGTTTTYEALSMGLPVVTTEGNSHRSRVSASILRHLGRGEWVAQTPDEFASIARELVLDREKLNATRLGLRDELHGSSICDVEDFVQHLEAAYQEMWRRYVDETI